MAIISRYLINSKNLAMEGIMIINEWFYPGQGFGKEYYREFSIVLNRERTEEEVAFLEFILDEICFVEGSILDLCCGWGRIIRGLWLPERSLYGLDMSLEYLEIARSKLASGVNKQRLNLICGDMISLPFTKNIFECVFCWFHSFGYFSKEKNQESLEEARRTLLKGGWLILDLVDKEWATNRGESHIKYKIDTDIECNQHDRPVRDIWETVRIYKWKNGKRKTVRAHYYLFTPIEIAQLLRFSGFSIEHIFQPNDERLPNWSWPWRFVVIARK